MSFRNIHYYDKPLLETYHITDIFNNCIESIIKNIKNFKIDKIEYTGWNYIYFEDKCINCKNANIEIPIYIKLTSDIEALTTSVNNRLQTSITDKIIININYNTISDYDIKALFAHEFEHIRKMYITEKNLLDLACINCGNIYKNLDFEIDERNKAIFQMLIDYFSPNEQDARITGTINYLNNIDSIKDKKLEILLEMSNDYHWLYYIKNELDSLKYRAKYISPMQLLVLGYFLMKFKYIKKVCSISLEEAKNFYKYDYEYNYSDNDRKNAVLICHELETNYEKFRIKLLDTISVKNSK